MALAPQPFGVSLSGRIGAGKTTLARALCAQLDATYIGIGDHVRTEAARRGVPLERDLLQELGRELISRAGGDGPFVGCLVSGADMADGTGMVIDGVRALEMREALDAISEQTLHVHVEISEKTRQARLLERGADSDATARADAHASEAAIELLRRHADLLVAGDDLDAAVREVVDALRRTKA